MRSRASGSACRERPVGPHHVLDGVGGVEDRRVELGRGSAALHVEDLLDEVQESSTLAPDGGEEVGDHVRRQLPALEGLHAPEDGGERSPQLVADGGDELGLHAVQLEELGHVGPFRLVEAGVGDRHRRVLGEEGQGPKVVLGELAVAVAVDVQDSEDLAPVDQRDAHGRVDGRLVLDQVVEALAVGRP